MTAPLETDVAIVGAGVAGVLVAREALRAGRRAVVIERGAWRSHAEQLVDGRLEATVPSARHNHEAAPGTTGYPWNYVYGVGGSTLAWAGVAPRFLPADFELRSRHGVGVDWPIGYDDLAADYAEAERALAVAGAPHPLFPGAEPPLPPHPPSALDELVGPLLEPYATLAQARPTRALGGRRECCGGGTCGLCPVDSRYSALHTLADERMLEDDGFRLLDRTVVARLRMDGGRVAGVECADGAGGRFDVRAGEVVLAASGLENPGILLRSGLDGPHVGRWLFDHEHALVELELECSAHPGRGGTPATGTTYLYAEGDWRGERGSAFVVPVNLGARIGELVAAELAHGRRGAALRRAAAERFERTLVLDIMADDVPRASRRVELSPRHDAFGLPLNRIRYDGPSAYHARAVEHVVADVERRLRPLGARLRRVVAASQGGHLLGTCRMGDDGVVDADLRHHAHPNLSIVGGSAFPAYSAAHPTLTIAALAIRLGRRLGAGG